MALGLKKGERIVTISNNRPEWNFMDMGMSQAGMIHVPVYPTLSEDDYEYILNHSEPSLIFMSDKLLCDKIGPIARKAGSIKEIYSFNEIDGIKNWKEIIELGKQNEKKYKEELEKIKKEMRYLYAGVLNGGKKH